MQITALKRTTIITISILLALTASAEMPEPNVEPTVRITRGNLEELPDPGRGAVVQGRFTDEQGNPLECILVQTGIKFPGVPFYARYHTYTDTAGRYALELPWSGFTYDISAHGSTFLRESRRIDVVPEQELDFVLRPQPKRDGPAMEAYTFSGVVRDGDSGEAVAGAEVKQYGHEGRTRSTTTDAEGHFIFPPEVYFNRAFAVARHGEKVSPVADPKWERDTVADLLLGPPGGLAGRLHLNESDDPAAGGVVALTRGPKQFEALYVAKADAKGDYTLGDLPPGTYRYAAHLPYPGADRERFYNSDDEVVVEPGRVTRLELHVEEHVRIAGRVVGPGGEPAAFALVHSGNLPSVEFQTDEQGRFSESVPARSKRALQAFSPKYGYGVTQLPEGKYSELDSSVEIRLNGMARIRGVLQGPLGEPVADVRLLDTTSGDSGRFDAGLLPVPLSPEGFKIDLYLPRPDPGFSYWLDEAERKKNDGKRSYYYATPTFVTASYGDDIHLDVTLVKAPLRELHGTLVSPDGTPEPGISVFVYAGMPTTAQWLERAAPEKPTGAQTGGPAPNPATLIATTTTDDSGNWSLRMVPEVGDRSRAYGDEYHPNNLVVLAVDGEQRRMAMMAQQIVSDNETTFEFPMVLRPAPPELVMWARVVDTGGKPLAGVQWYVNNSFGTYVSDALGLVPINRLREVPSLKLINQEYYMVEALPQAAGPIAGQRVASIPHVARVITYAWPGPEPKRGIQSDGKFLILDFVDDENACIVITLDRCEDIQETTP